MERNMVHFNTIVRALVSLGRERENANQVAQVHISLTMGASKLTRHSEEGRFDECQITCFQGSAPTSDILSSADNLPFYDNILMPSWKKLADALSSAPLCQDGYITLILVNLGLENAVKDVLLRSLQQAPIKSLYLANNGLGSEGIKFLVDVLKVNNAVKALFIEYNPIVRKSDVQSFVEAVKNHPSVSRLGLNYCCLDQIEGAVSAILPVFESMTHIRLRGNKIGSIGAALISNCLAGNPLVTHLDLGDNVLNDDDATTLADALKKNTTLRAIVIKGNRMTDDGSRKLWSSVFECASMNGIYESNHTCHIISDWDSVSRWNKSVDPKCNRNTKLLAVMQYCYILPGLQQVVCEIDGLSIKLIPIVLALLQGLMTKSEMRLAFLHDLTKSEKRLEVLFQLIRERILPRLFMSREGPEPLQGTRTKKRKVA